MNMPRSERPFLGSETVDGKSPWDLANFDKVMREAMRARIFRTLGELTLTDLKEVDALASRLKEQHNNG